MRYGMTPGVHVYLVSAAGVGKPEDALEAWKVATRQARFLDGSGTTFQFREMTPDEVKANTPEGARCTTNDVGFLPVSCAFDLARNRRNSV